jgi:hypothetical protein
MRVDTGAPELRRILNGVRVRASHGYCAAAWNFTGSGAPVRMEHPGFSAVAPLTLGIGTNIAMFTSA